MKKRETISELLGIKQEEIAHLLQINRSQWSMFESGKRSLPAAANILLAEMLNHIQASEASKKLPHLVKHEETNKEELEKWLKENEYQLLLIARKIETAQKKYKGNIKALHLSCFPVSQENKQA